MLLAVIGSVSHAVRGMNLPSHMVILTCIYHLIPLYELDYHVISVCLGSVMIADAGILPSGQGVRVPQSTGLYGTGLFRNDIIY